MPSSASRCSKQQQQQHHQQHQEQDVSTAPQHSQLAIRLTLLAAIVRTAYLLLVLFFSHLIKDYDTSASLLSESCHDTWPLESAEAAAKHTQYLPGVVWDSVFLHRIAACGYEYEQFFAFYPGLPGLVWLLRSTGLLPGPLGFTVIVLTLNTCCFLVSVWLLTRLGQKVIIEERVVATSVLIFIFSPASIHHSMLYTEALFTTTSWLGLYCLYCCQASFAASLAFAASASLRSNGLLNAGFILHEHGRQALHNVHRGRWGWALWQVSTAVVYTAICAAPYLGYLIFSYKEFCTGVYGPTGPFEPRPWCGQTVPSAYGYVQRVYWYVGFLRYYSFSQIPNFLLAGPTLVISLWGALAYAAANPHVMLTGGLLPAQLVDRFFGRSHAPQGCHAPCGWSSGAVVGGTVFCAGSKGGHDAGAAGRGAAGVKAAMIPGVTYQPLRRRQQQASGHRQAEQQPQGKLQELLNDTSRRAPGVAATAAPKGTCAAERHACGCSSNAAYYRPQAAVFVIHWLVLTLVCLAVVHIQVSTRLLSSCAPLYWFAALLMLHQGRVLRSLLWWYCFAYMGVGAVMFINFLPWT